MAARDERQGTLDRDVGVNPDESGVPMFAGILVEGSHSSIVARRFRHGFTRQPDLSALCRLPSR
jgi:hypothetical protein